MSLIFQFAMGSRQVADLQTPTLEAKSAFTSGFRFRNGTLIQTTASEMTTSEVMTTEVNYGRTYLFEGLLVSQTGAGKGAGLGTGVNRRGSLNIMYGSSAATNSAIWESLQFWEDVFCGE